MSETIAAAIQRITDQLKAAGIDNPRREARLLTCHHLSIDLASLLARDTHPIDTTTLNELATRRASHEPLAYITGKRGFWKHDFIVSPDVLIPRPETELIVEHAIAAKPAKILDLGTGSGAILLSILADCPNATGIGTDRSERALRIAQTNAQNLKLTHRCHLIAADWATALKGQFNLIVSNPPYIREHDHETLDATVRHFEPKLALTAGKDGLNAYRQILQQAPNLLTLKGRLLLEIGHDQGDDVAQLCTAHGLSDVTILKDLAGLDRVVHATNLV